MRLKKLQVAGFKSFVDSTDIRLPSYLVGVVGPNGCGKSNVIDAVRWVMGESSAKMLRGDNMGDVIFNGSSARKPVGRASVELTFDNHDGHARGNYGQFAEISIKRTLTRDGQSIYQINNMKTRRKDVLDLFRGTGLGPRSYSIIEQGMVGRIVEARPEDLRLFVEEVAGTSKYKERRKETKNRIAQTRENLDRVADIRDELGKQLRRLKRQSASARRYKALKAQEREINGQLQLFRLNELNGQLEEQDRLTAKHENSLQHFLALQRETEAGVEAIRKQQSDAHEKNNRIQQEFYQAVAEITNLEQEIEHRKENSLRQSEEIDRLQKACIEYQNRIESETSRETACKRRLDELSPEFETCKTKWTEAESQLLDAEKIFQDWLNEMEYFNEQSREPAQQVEVQKSRIAYLQQHRQRAEESKVKLDSRLNLLSGQVSAGGVESLRKEVRERDRVYAGAEKEYEESERNLKLILSNQEQKRESAAISRAGLKEIASRLTSLQEIQQAGLEDNTEDYAHWLNRHDLEKCARLIGQLKITAGWERATDRILDGFLNAVCVERISEDLLGDRPGMGFSMISNDMVAHSPGRISLPRLLDKVETGASRVAGLMSGVYACESLEQGLKYRQRLSGGECIVTREGELIGANWVSFAGRSQTETGMLAREEEIARLQEQKRRTGLEIEAVEKDLQGLDARRKRQEQILKSQKTALNDLRSELTALHNRFGREEAQYNDAREQAAALADESNELSGQISAYHAEIENANALLNTAMEQSGKLDQQREKLARRKEELNARVVANRESVNSVRERYHQKSLAIQKIKTDMGTMRENVRRMKDELKDTEKRLSVLKQSQRSTSDDAILELQKNLEMLFEKKLEIDSRFSAAREVVSSFDDRITEADNLRNDQVARVNDAQEALSRQKLERQEVLVRRDTLVEAINEQGYDIDEEMERLPEDGGVNEWRIKLEAVEKKIARIGPVNLVAIEEFGEQSERMEYLDKQHTDLTEALDTLESVIRKIDRETRSRFRETFDKINGGFNQFFPKLFGGGSAELHLTSDDLLTAGISVMARPPGKRNSHIHLLSGGEKALTAVALLFSLFELNPAPFCMLDEVDAPLDDANVDRYCQTLKTLASKSQMIVITHNKITMEAMDVLVGVTMAEAGVSRLVSVDIDQAVEMAAQ